MEYQYKKDLDGYHFYRIGEKILHVFHIDKDCIITDVQEHLTTETEFSKDDCVINIVSGLRNDKKFVDCSKEEFENKLRQVIYILDISDVCKNFN